MPGNTMLAVAVVLGAALAGCSAAPWREKQYASSADKWVGHTVDELIVANGEPVSVSRLESGNRVFKYLMDRSSSKTGARALKKDFSGKTYGNKAVTLGSPCFIVFSISSSDIVESWSLDGDKCE